MPESRAEDFSPLLDDTEQRKRALRKRMQALRDGLSAESGQELSRAAQQRLLADPLWQGADTVLLYAAFRSETATQMLLENAWKSGKRVLLPRCCREGGALTGALDMVPVRSFSDLAAGAYGIEEPALDVCAPPLDITDATTGCGVDLAVLPGVAFDAKGGRLGYGGGYYDRLIGSGALTGARLLGFCYELQVVPSLPAAPWDIPVHGLCTEERLEWS